MDFEWNETKARTNHRKHGVSLSEATEVFSDEHSSYVQDPDHSYDEDRYLLFGVSLKDVPCRFVYRKIRDYPNHFSAANDPPGA